MQPSADIVWGAAQQQLRAMLNTDIYNLWFLPIKATALGEDTLTLEVANDFCEVWLKDNYLGLIHDVLMQASGQNLKVKFHVNPAGAGSRWIVGP
jgi:chromosomal replication initiator protein